MSSKMFYMVEEQSQMVHDLCPQGQSATADGMVRALINIYTDARATQRKSMKSEQRSQRRLPGREASQAQF